MLGITKPLATDTGVILDKKSIKNYTTRQLNKLNDDMRGLIGELETIDKMMPKDKVYLKKKVENPIKKGYSIKNGGAGDKKAAANGGSRKDLGTNKKGKGKFTIRSSSNNVKLNKTVH